MGILPETEDTPPQASSQLQRQTQVSAGATATTSLSSSSSTGSEKRSPDLKPTDPSDVVHKIKKIKWQDIEVPIITQNNNGPCPLLAIVNVMILKVGYGLIFLFYFLHLRVC